MVSFINSLFDEFGSGVVVPGTGFALQDRGAGFTMRARTAEHRRAGQASVPHAHSGLRHEAGREARSRRTPDTPYMSFGLMGGAMQAQGHAQFLLNLLVFGMDIQQAMDAARFRHTGWNARGARERRFPTACAPRSRAMGHVVSEGPGSMMGGSQAIIRLAHGYAAGSDPRKDGMAVGY